MRMRSASLLIRFLVLAVVLAFSRRRIGGPVVWRPRDPHRTRQPKPPPPPCQPTDPCKNCTSSPCFVASGTYVTSATDLTIRTAGFPISIGRQYRSTLAIDGTVGLLAGRRASHRGSTTRSISSRHRARTRRRPSSSCRTAAATRTPTTEAGRLHLRPAATTPSCAMPMGPSTSSFSAPCRCCTSGPPVRARDDEGRLREHDHVDLRRQRASPTHRGLRRIREVRRRHLGTQRPNSDRPGFSRAARAVRVTTRAGIWRRSRIPPIASRRTATCRAVSSSC